MRNNGIRPYQVTALFTERIPCQSRGHWCRTLVQRLRSNCPVYYLTVQRGSAAGRILRNRWRAFVP
jgi:hypothetical protein